MANEYARNITDANLNEAASVALPTADTTSFSADIDLGAGAYKHENYELEITTPDGGTTPLPNDDTLTVAVVHGAAATPTTLLADNLVVYTGAGGVGYTGSTIRFRFPSNTLRYVRVRWTAAGGTGDLSALLATVGLRF